MLMYLRQKRGEQHVVDSYATETSLIFPHTVYFSTSRKVWVSLALLRADLPQVCIFQASLFGSSESEIEV